MGGSLFPGARLMLSAGTVPTAGFRQRVEAAQKAGFDAISLFPQQYLRARKAEKLSPADMRDILAEHAICVDEVDPLLDWFGEDASAAETLLFDIAAELGARSVNAPAAFAPELDPVQIGAALARLCRRARSFGLRIDLEFLPWTVVPDLETALQVAAHCDSPNLGITLDFWHFYRGGGSDRTLLDLSEHQVERITNLQLCDAPARPRKLNLRNRLAQAAVVLGQVSDGIRVNGAARFFKVSSAMKSDHPDAQALMLEASSDRCLPGEGDMPLVEWLQVLAGRGARPTLGMEIFSVDLARKPADLVARQAMGAYRRVADSALRA